MKRSKRLLAVILALTVAIGAAIPASAVTLESRCDEAYYATLDYYGALLEGGVVKSYDLGDCKTITDYGEYDEVLNLTDDVVPRVEDGQVTFELGDDAPEKFYFQGSTEKPLSSFPWTIAVSYQHNGAPAKAEDLAGKSGLFEIDLDVTPNPAASDYSRQNLVLTAATALNDDDLTSLEAPGAEQQLIGNLRVVLFAVLPGEEQHFEIRVGSDDFSFPGLMFLAVPATLGQLDQVADLRSAKEDAEDAIDTISDSMDTILEALDGVTDSLDSAAGGLEQLSAAMTAVSGSTGPVYASTDRATADLGTLAGTLGRLDADADTASQAVADVTEEVNGLHAVTQDLKPELETTRQLIADLQADGDELKSLLTGAEDYNDRAVKLAKSMAGTTADLQDAAGRLQSDLNRLESSLRRLQGMSGLDEISIGGITDANELRGKINQVKGLYQQYQTAQGSLPEGTTFEKFLILGAHREYCQAVGIEVPIEDFLATDTGKEAAATAQAAAQLQEAFGSMSDAELEQQLKMMETVNNTVIPTANDKIQEVNRLITAITGPTANVVDELGNLCGTMEESDDLYDLARLAQDLLVLLDDHEGAGASLLDHADEAGDLLTRLTGTADTALSQLDSLNGVLNTYEPALQTTLTDAKAISQALQATLRDSASAITALEDLMRVNGPTLSAGATAALDGAAAALRDAAIDGSPTGDLREAKAELEDLIQDQWDTHAGGHDTLLEIDPNAAPESMTSPRNASPQSLQYVLRTQEIRVDEAEADAASEEEAQPAPTTFWGRVKAMFRDLWNTITGWFR